VTPSAILESPFGTLRDLDVVVTMSYSLADDAVALAMLLVMTPPDAALTVVDP